MPNHVQNILVIEGHEMHLKPMLERIRNEDNPLDFNNIIPMPLELRGTCAPARIVTQSEYDKIEYQKNFRAKEKYPMGKSITKEMQKDYIERFGYDNWYDWACKKWGTKWGAYDVSIDEVIPAKGKNRKQVTIRFQSAWSSPVNVIYNLAHQFPTLDYYLSYADEDCGSNTGQFWFKEGVEENRNLPKTGSNEAMELYFTCWDNDREGWEKINGEWKYTAEDW